MSQATMKDRTYLGETIRACESAEQGPGTAHRGRWIVQTYHGPTGLSYGDQDCPHYQTLALAREGIEEHLDHVARAAGWR